MWLFGAKRKMKWISSSGGPLVLLPESRLESWFGADGPQGQTHYQLACAMGEICSSLLLDGVNVLILGDDPVPATWVVLDRGGIIIRWIAADSESELLSRVQSFAKDLKGETVLSFNWSDQKCFLVDSVNPGADAEDSLSIQMPLGIYDVSTHVIQESKVSFYAIKFSLKT